MPALRMGTTAGGKITPRVTSKSKNEASAPGKADERPTTIVATAIRWVCCERGSIVSRREPGSPQKRELFVKHPLLYSHIVILG